ncbi:MAG: putative RNA methyltransferase [Ostreibacterium sp.]
MLRLICPHCQYPLQQTMRQLSCQNGHCFDRGKSGDVNLLLPNQKKSKSPGDSKVMVNARRDFLASGAYQPIAEMLARVVMVLAQGEPKVIADAGCGEGYYLRHIQGLCFPNLDFFTDQGGIFLGWDISKYAVQSAAKQSDRETCWITASNAAVPLANDSIDILFSTFGFEVEREFSRIVKKAGYVIIVEVGEQHLIELRKHIYPEIKPFSVKPLLSKALFKYLKQDNVTYKITLDNTQLATLMLMTPHFYRATVEYKDYLLSLSELSVTIEVNVKIYLQLA